MIASEFRPVLNIESHNAVTGAPLEFRFVHGQEYPTKWRYLLLERSRQRRKCIGKRKPRGFGNKTR